MLEDAAKLKREWACLWRPFLFLLIFRSTTQIGRIAEVPGASNIWRYKTRSARPFSMHSGNCAAKDRVRFPCGRAKPQGPGFWLQDTLECFYPTIECAGGRILVVQPGALV